MDEARKRATKQQLRRAECQQYLRGLPLRADVLELVLEEADEALEDSGCDHSFRHLEVACQRRDIDPALLISWLRERGHLCDCEAVDNVRGWLEEALKEAPGPRTQ